MLSTRSLLLSLLALLFLAACTSSAVRSRRDQREKLVKEGGKIYCEFLNGEAYPDIDIALNLEMAKRCDPEQSISITNYKSPAETSGLVYCCTTIGKATAKLDKNDKLDKADKADKMDKGDDLSLDEKPAPAKAPAAPAPAAPSAPSAPAIKQ